MLSFRSYGTSRINSMVGISTLLLSSTLVSFLSLMTFKRLAATLGLLDRPCTRKRHDGHVPLVGGMSIFLAICVSVTMFVSNSQSINLFLIASSLMVFIGVLDDKYDLSVRSRLIGQFLISSILIFGVDRYISSLGDLFGLGEVYLGLAGIPITFVAIIAAINAFNMVDGIDGLLGSCAIVAFAGLSYSFYQSGDVTYFYICVGVIAAIAPFLLANFGIYPFQKKKIFMGDAGSMFIGLAVVWFLVLGTQPHNEGVTASFKPVLALYIVGFPLMDMVAVIIRRLKNKKSPMKPGRDHAHHILMHCGFSNKQVLALLVTFYSLLLVSGFLLSNFVSDLALFGVFLTVFIGYLFAFQVFDKAGEQQA